MSEGIPGWSFEGIFGDIIAKTPGGIPHWTPRQMSIKLCREISEFILIKLVLDFAKETSYAEALQDIQALITGEIFEVNSETFFLFPEGIIAGSFKETLPRRTAGILSRFSSEAFSKNVDINSFESFS